MDEDILNKIHHELETLNHQMNVLIRETTMNLAIHASQHPHVDLRKHGYMFLLKFLLESNEPKDLKLFLQQSGVGLDSECLERDLSSLLEELKSGFRSQK